MPEASFPLQITPPTDGSSTSQPDYPPFATISRGNLLVIPFSEFALWSFDDSSFIRCVKHQQKCANKAYV